MDFVAARGLFGGNEKDEFEPQRDMDCGTLVTVLHRPAYEPREGSVKFDGVLSGTWYSDAVVLTQTKGVVKGCNGGSFRPDDVITREQLVSVLYRYAQTKGYNSTVFGSLENFTDAGTVHAYEKDAMDRGGTGGDRPAPSGTAAREQAAAIFTRFCEKAVKSSNQRRGLGPASFRCAPAAGEI